jgi:putative cardiolipin synthase
MKGVLLVTFILLMMGSCASLPPNSANLKSYVLVGTEDTRLGKTFQELKKKSSEESAFLLLDNGLDAFAARLAISLDAERSIDIQYYMFGNDLTGRLLADQLLKAADRGVRVRVLLDDIDLSDRDENLAVFANHPNINLRVFNPFSRNALRGSQLITRFGSVTRRMHNKSFTVDNQVTVLGGRNIGDEYFGADSSLAFDDFDILVRGPVVHEVSTFFDAYWNSELSFPVEVLHHKLIGEGKLEKGRELLAAYLLQDEAVNYQQSLYSSDFSKRLRANSLQYMWGEAKVLSDYPQKIESYDEEKVYELFYQMDIFLQSLHKELIIFSPYFVPGKKGTRNISKLSKSGVRVRIITNSFASTDVPVVHAGYMKYRTTLLRNGVELYEMNKTMSRELKKRKHFYGASKTSLHGKSLIIDREMVFIGSLNLDPRSVTENTEIGVMLMSSELAETMAKIFDSMVESSAFRLELRTDDEGLEHIYWHGLENGEERVWKTEPHTSFWSRLSIFLIGLLPFESQL